jgi:hypothetical protein
MPDFSSTGQYIFGMIGSDGASQPAIASARFGGICHHSPASIDSAYDECLLLKRPSRRPVVAGDRTAIDLLSRGHRPDLLPGGFQARLHGLSQRARIDIRAHRRAQPVVRQDRLFGRP